MTELEEFYAAHAHELTLQLFAYTGSLVAAEDVVQEAFCRAIPRWDRLSRYDDPAGWVRRVAWNLATSRWRSIRTAARLRTRLSNEPVPGPNPDRVALIAALRTLPATHRRVLVLHYMADMTSEEIAKQEEVAASTVRVWLMRGRAQLADVLREPSDSLSSRSSEGARHA